MDILESIGNTPLVELTRMNPHRQVRVLAKLEGNNPGGSIKDRPALAMIQKARQEGLLGNGRIILEPTSGNTGIALAMIGAAMGYPVTLTLPACVSSERQHVLEAFGARVVLTPAREGTDGAIRQAHRMLSEQPDRYFMPNQFANPHNWLAHYETTGPEIYAQTGGAVDVFVTGMGTTGTLMGMSRYLKEKVPGVWIAGVEPEAGHAIQGLKNMREAIVPAIYEPGRLDEIISMTDGVAFETARRLAVEEGIFAGISSGANVAAALQIAGRLERGTVVTIICDRGDRYLSTTLFRSICAKCPP
ncbi:MAG: cysteine synthase family protein [Sedimentisphaerales bacterium]|nr:cysteine synthase family protein [Sedimentisphaerales bacterium]